MLKYQAFFVFRRLNLEYDKRVVHLKHSVANATLLIVESNLTDTVKAAKNRGWLSAGETYGSALRASASNGSFDICMPHSEDFHLNDFDLTSYDGFVFTGHPHALRGTTSCISTNYAAFILFPAFFNANKYVASS